MLFTVIRPITLVLTAAILVGCAGDTSLREKITHWDPFQYTVSSGDTLYSIAWRYDQDFKDLVAWNNIPRPYTIYPGQRLHMRKPPETVEQVSESPVPVSTTYPVNQSQVESRDYSDPDNVPPAPPLNGQSRVPVISKTNKKHGKTRHKPAKPGTKPGYSGPGTVRWNWPLKGKVVSTFAVNNNSRKGVDIRASAGAKIRAASAGEVVYSGSGLLSYGNLIIIKHNDQYLSAYAYNRSLLVKEGSVVKQGEAIAVLGDQSDRKNILHFEIRKDGKPVNPLVYLPKS